MHAYIYTDIHQFIGYAYDINTYIDIDMYANHMHAYTMMSAYTYIHQTQTYTTCTLTKSTYMSTRVLSRSKEKYDDNIVYNFI